MKPEVEQYEATKSQLRVIIIVGAAFFAGMVIGIFSDAHDYTQKMMNLEWRLASKEERIEKCEHLLGKDFWQVSFP